MRQDRFSRAAYEGQIGLAVLIQRGRHADEHSVHLAQPGEIRSGPKPLPAHFSGGRGGGDMLDVGFTALQLLGLEGVNIKPRGLLPYQKADTSIQQIIDLLTG